MEEPTDQMVEVVTETTTNEQDVNSGESTEVNTEETDSAETKKSELTDEDKYKYATEKRIKKLSRDKADSNKRIEALEKQLKDSQSNKVERPRDEYTDDEWSDKRLDDKLNEREAKELEAQNHTTKTKEMASRWDESIKSFGEEMPDYAEVVSEIDVDIPMDAIEIIQESEVGPRMVYHLAKNLAEAEKLSTLSPKARERYMLKLEMKMESYTPPVKEQVSRAQATPKGSGSTVAPSVNLGDMNTADFMKAFSKRRHG